MHAVRHAIGEVAADRPARVILLGMVELIASASSVDIDLLAPRLLAYGHALDLEGRYALAADVLQTVVEYVHPVHHADVAADAYMRLGFCLRMLGRMDDASAAYSAAGTLARAMKDEARTIRARVADGKLALARGNLPAAAAIFDETVRAASSRPELTELRSAALHDRAAVAFAAGEHEAAAHFAFAALEGTIRPAARDRVLADLATMLIQLGARDAAHDALSILVEGADEQYTRWMARINLLELAVLENAELMFEQHRRALRSVELPVDLAANYHLHVGLGYHAFGRHAAAEESVEHACALATSHSLHQLAFQAERLLEMLRSRASSATVAARVPLGAPRSLEPVTTAIRRLREAASIG